MPAMRVVLDTNVLVSALVFSSDALSRLRPAWQSGTLLPLASPDAVAELERERERAVCTTRSGPAIALRLYC